MARQLILIVDEKTRTTRARLVHMHERRAAFANPRVPWRSVRVWSIAITRYRAEGLVGRAPRNAHYVTGRAKCPAFGCEMPAFWPFRPGSSAQFTEAFSQLAEAFTHRRGLEGQNDREADGTGPRRLVAVSSA
jgi:hypothetical protein